MFRAITPRGGSLNALWTRLESARTLPQSIMSASESSSLKLSRARFCRGTRAPHWMTATCKAVGIEPTHESVSCALPAIARYDR
jgi:hypothetical protein